MKIGLLQVDGKYPNLALTKLSAWHKQKCDNVDFYTPLEEYDRIYMSKIFDFTPDYFYPLNAPEIIRGGWAYNAETLSSEIENLCPDYDLFPFFEDGNNYAMGFTSRGCVRDCPFCIVPVKEGKLKPVGDIYGFWRGQKYIRLLDNNLNANHEHFKLICSQLIKEKIKTDFNQGLDARFIDDEQALILSKVKLWKSIHMAFDSVNDESEIVAAIHTLLKYMPTSRLMFYVLIGFDSTPEEDFHRVELLRSYGVSPFVMAYDKSDPYQRAYARYVNHKAIFKSVKWDEYKGNPLAVQG